MKKKTFLFSLTHTTINRSGGRRDVYIFTCVYVCIVLEKYLYRRRRECTFLSVLLRSQKQNKFISKKNLNKYPEHYSCEHTHTKTYQKNVIQFIPQQQQHILFKRTMKRACSICEGKNACTIILFISRVINFNKLKL